MHGQGSAFAALGLEPGARRDEIELAYRRLIKLHHPDRDGGNADRAAEINWAYAELRRQPVPDWEQAPVAAMRRRRSSGRRRAARRRARARNWSMLTIALCALGLLQAHPLAGRIAQGWNGLERALEPVVHGSGQRRGDPATIEDPLSAAAISNAASLASQLTAAGREEAIADYSRRCHRELRVEPSVVDLDRCVAFDAAVATLSEGGAMPDGGRFGASELTARHMTAASLLSSDYLAIERRLDQVRSAVELQLRPALPPPQDGA